MSERFDGLTKIPDEPAKRLLAGTNLKLETELSLPATASVAQVLAELEKAAAPVDMLKVLAASLPAREGCWWACLAARDVVGKGEPSAALKAAEAWVFRPSDQTRKAAFEASEAAERTDDTALCATIAVYADGTLGPGDLNEHAAPAGAAAAMVFAMNLMGIDALGGDFAESADYVLDRALDIARGGNGRIERKMKVDA